MIIARFKPEHLWEIELQPAQRPSWDAYRSTEYARSLTNGPAYTARQDGKILFCGGLVDCGHFAHLWSFMSVHAAAHLVAIHRTAKRVLSIAWQPVVVATSDARFAQGCRWLELLGFQRDDTLPGYGTDGADHVLYLRAS